MQDKLGRNLTLEVTEGVALLTVERPKVLNALDSATLDELEQVFSELEVRDSVRSIIVTGSGEKAFVAGADIRELTELNSTDGRAFSRRGQRVFTKIENSRKPVIAAVNGFCLGGGCELALSCHIRIASENAVFGLPEVKLGLVPGYGGTQRLARLVGRGMALEIILSGEKLGAQEALRIGLVNRVVPLAELLGHCRGLARHIQANGPIAVGLAIQAITKGLEMPLPEALALESHVFGEACASEDKNEGVQAFLQKRQPLFRGS